MIPNYDELLVSIEEIEFQLQILKQKKQARSVLNSQEILELFSKEQFLKLQILNYIKYYQNDNETDLKKNLCLTKLHFIQEKYFPKIP